MPARSHDNFHARLISAHNSARIKRSDTNSRSTGRPGLVDPQRNASKTFEHDAATRAYVVLLRSYALGVFIKFVIQGEILKAENDLNLNLYR